MPKKKTYEKDELSYPFAFRKLPYHIQHSRPKDYRWVEYDYAAYKAKQWGIRSARQWRSFVQFFNPAGMPTNPDKVYRRQWESWDVFLDTDNTYAGYDPNSVKHDELLPFNDAVAWMHAQRYPNVEAYFESFDRGEVPKGIPRQPQVRYKEFYPKGGWKYFLGKKLSHVVDAKKNAEPVCALCQSKGQRPNVLQLVISSYGAQHLQQEIADNPNLTAVKAYYWYHEYAPYVFEMLDKMGTKQSENSWLFNDVNALYYELGSVLEPYVPR
jgi:hypothetical protein